MKNFWAGFKDVCDAKLLGQFTAAVFMSVFVIVFAALLVSVPILITQGSFN